MKGTIDRSATAAPGNVKAQKDFALKNNTPFSLCISKINNTLIDNAEDLDNSHPI